MIKIVVVTYHIAEQPPQVLFSCISFSFRPFTPLSSSYAFPRSIFRQSSNLSCTLHYLLHLPCFFVSNLSGMRPAHLIRLFPNLPTMQTSVPIVILNLSFFLSSLSLHTSCSPNPLILLFCQSVLCFILCPYIFRLGCSIHLILHCVLSMIQDCQ